jgi:glycosyltransferase involved in cell wall biosynthesis
VRVVHVDRQRSWSGQVARVHRVARALCENGHDLLLVTHPGSRLEERARRDGLPVRALPLRGAAFYASAPRFLRLLSGRRIDVLHCHGARDHQLAWLARRLGLAAHLVRTKHNHTPLRRGGWSRALYAGCSRVVTVSEHARERLAADGVDPRRIETIPDAVDVGRFAPRAPDEALRRELGLEPDRPVVGHVSRLSPRKGVEELLRAVRLLRDQGRDAGAEVLVLGGASDAWRALARELGLSERIHFGGFREQVAPVLSLCGVFAYPSHQEALGIAALEAMAMQVPVVAGDVGGLREAVTPEVGVRVPPGDPGALADALSALLADPERRRRLGRAGRERVLAHFSDAALVARTLALYEELASRP